jgi:hypothetical protein
MRNERARDLMDTPALTGSYPTLEQRLELIENVPDSTAELIELVLERRSVAEGYVSGELCVALYLWLRSCDDALDSGEFLAIFQRRASRRGDDSDDFVVTNGVGGEGELPERHIARVDDAVLVDLGEVLQDDERMPSVVWLKPAQGGDVRRVDHLNDGEAVEVAEGKSSGEVDSSRVLFCELLPLAGDNKLPSEMVESGSQVMDHIPDPATPLKDRRFFARFDEEDVIGAFRIGFSPDANYAELVEGSDFFVKGLGMTLGLTELGVAAIERLQRAAG